LRSSVSIVTIFVSVIIIIIISIGLYEAPLQEKISSLEDEEKETESRGEQRRGETTRRRRDGVGGERMI